MAEEGIRALGAAIPPIVEDSADDRMPARDALYGAWLCGTVLGSTSMALHHKLCHVLGGTLRPAACRDPYRRSCHTPTAYNAAAAAVAMARVAHALGVDSAPQGLFDLAKTAGAPTSLRELGMPEGGLDRAADIAAANPYYESAADQPRRNPRAARRCLARQTAGSVTGRKRECRISTKIPPPLRF